MSSFSSSSFLPLLDPPSLEKRQPRLLIMNMEDVLLSIDPFNNPINIIQEWKSLNCIIPNIERKEKEETNISSTLIMAPDAKQFIYELQKENISLGIWSFMNKQNLDKACSYIFGSEYEQLLTCILDQRYSTTNSNSTTTLKNLKQVWNLPEMKKWNSTTTLVLTNNPLEYKGYEQQIINISSFTHLQPPYEMNTTRLINKMNEIKERFHHLRTGGTTTTSISQILNSNPTIIPYSPPSSSIPEENKKEEKKVEEVVMEIEEEKEEEIKTSEDDEDYETGSSSSSSTSMGEEVIEDDSEEEEEGESSSFSSFISDSETSSSSSSNNKEKEGESSSSSTTSNINHYRLRRANAIIGLESLRKEKKNFKKIYRHFDFSSDFSLTEEEEEQEKEKEEKEEEENKEEEKEIITLPISTSTRNLLQNRLQNGQKLQKIWLNKGRKYNILIKKPTITTRNNSANNKRKWIKQSSFFIRNRKPTRELPWRACTTTSSTNRSKESLFTSTSGFNLEKLALLGIFNKKRI